MESSVAGNPPAQAQSGLLKRWFPGWGGWYGQASPPVESDTSVSRQNLSKEDTAIKEKEIGDYVTHCYRIGKTLCFCVSMFHV